MPHDVKNAIEQLFALRHSRTTPCPRRHTIEPFVSGTLGLLFDEHAEVPYLSLDSLLAAGSKIATNLEELAKPILESSVITDRLVAEFIEALPTFFVTLLQDASAIYEGDPAARNVEEVIVSYPGFLAIAVYRIANWFHLRPGIDLTPLPRMITEYAHQLTGVDIHPGATIGGSFVIDHGTGIVIGETTVIEQNVKMYQGVTLGALSVEKSLANQKRHPTIERDVVIYANATILGGNTTIGSGTIVGGNVWITASVPANSRVYHRSDVTIRAGD